MRGEVPAPLVESLVRTSGRLLGELLQRTLGGLQGHLAAYPAESEDDPATIHMVEIKRQALLDSYRQGLESAVFALTAAPAAPQEAILAETISLVDDADMELTVIAQTAISRVRLQNAGLLSRYKEGLQKLIPRALLNERTLPLDPQQVTDIFCKALQDNGFNVRQSIRLFSVFNQGVLAKLGDVLQAVVQELIDAAVLVGEGQDRPLAIGDSTPRSLLQLPEVLDTVQQKALSSLSDLLAGVFDGIDQSLYELVRDASETEQADIRLVLQELKKGRNVVEQVFSESMQSSFRTLLLPKGKLQVSDSLVLVDNTDMELSVVTQTMVSRARLANAGALEQLTQRYVHLMPKAEVSERTLPFDPQQVIDAFRNGLSHLPLQLDDKIKVFSVFNKQVLNDYGVVLDAANDTLVDAGILPEASSRRIKKSVSVGPARPIKTGSASNAVMPSGVPMIAVSGGPVVAVSGAPVVNGENRALSGEGVFLREEMFASLQGLLATARAKGWKGASSETTAVATDMNSSPAFSSVMAVPLAPVDIPAGAAVQAIETRELMSMLSDIQQRLPRAALYEDDSSPTPEEVRESIVGGLVQTDSEVQTVRQADEDVINLVSMLFDFILDDDELPTPMKALLGRLQIPLLKVAILDKMFFSAEEHPARQLLSLLARAGVGWSDKAEGGDALYAKIEEVVYRILNEFVEDLGIFDDLLSEFSDFFALHQKRQALMERRVQEAEDGRARADLARAMVQQTLNRRLSDRQIPLIVVRILQEAWRAVLYWNCLKHGTESEEWKLVVKVVDVLLWSVQPQPNPEWRKKMAEVRPRLVNSLKKGLAVVHYDGLMLDALLWDLNAIHERLMEGDQTPTVAVVTAGTEAAVVKELASGQIVAANELAMHHAETVNTVVLPAESVQERESATVTVSEDDPALAVVEQMQPGAWIEIHGEETLRCRLVARIRSIDKLIFANRRGVKVMETSSAQMMQDIKNRKVRVLDDGGQFFDRALENVIGALRATKPEAA